MADNSIVTGRRAVGADPVTVAALHSATLAPEAFWASVRGAGGAVFVFPGSGWEWPRSTLELLAESPAFACEMRRCDAAFAEFTDWSLTEALLGDHPSINVDRAEVLQPALFAVTASVVAHARAQGVRPDAVLGRATGEVAAAYVAGALPLRDAARVVTELGAAIDAVDGVDGMLSIPLPEHRVRPLLDPWGEAVSIVGQDDTRVTVVAGGEATLDALSAELRQDRVSAARVPVDPDARARQLDEVRERLRETLADLAPQRTDIVFVSSVTGAGLDTSILDGDYWFANVRQRPLFPQAVRWAYEYGCRTFLEANPVPTLTDVVRGAVGAP
jgi:acyl transferase domain-containing protein